MKPLHYPEQKPSVTKSKEQNTLDFLKLEIKNNGRPPTLRDVQKYLGVGSTVTVRRVLRKLQNQGYIEYHKSISRGIRVLELPDFTQVPTVPEQTALKKRIDSNKSEILENLLIEFLQYLNSEGLVSGNDFIYKKEARKFLKKLGRK